MACTTLPVITDTSTALPRVSRSLGRWALAAAWLAAGWLAAGAAVAQETLDQSNAPANWGGGAHHITTRAAQSVSPTLTCLTHVEIGLMTGNRGRGGDQVTLTVLDWSPYPLKQLAKVTVNVPEGFDGFLKFTMPGGGIEVPHYNVALQVNDTGKNVFWWKYQTGNPYPGGEYFFGGYGDGSLDYLFKTYGRGGCSFSLGVTPDPVTVVQGGTSTATIGVTRGGGFTAPVNVTLVLPGGVTASPATLAISGSRVTATTTFSATAGATTGSFPATAKGTASGASASQSFQVKVTPAAALKVTSVTPSVQQKGGTITVMGSGFDPNCGPNKNMLSFAGVSVMPTTCSTSQLTATVPPPALYGPTTLKVTSSGRPASNEVAFSVGRQQGNFVEITSDVRGKHTSRSCAGATAKVDVVPSGTGYVATYREVPDNSLIGTAIAFQPDFSYPVLSWTQTLVDIGGAGFSLCSVGLVFDAGNGAARLFLMDLEKGKDAAFQGSPYTVYVRVPRLPSPMSEDYQPRFFRSPDGTIILAISAGAPSGPGTGDNIVATFFDKVAGGILKRVPITIAAGTNSTGNPTPSVTLGADNRITLVFYPSQTLAPISIP